SAPGAKRQAQWKTERRVRTARKSQVKTGNRVMSLYGALFTGVAGLAANSRAMATTSTNIANVNTVGYKTTKTEFSTLLASSPTSGASANGGVKAVPIAEISQAGDLAQTNSSTDLAITGQGFFVVTSQATANPSVAELYYTRA